jgi:hypothetical protein
MASALARGGKHQINQFSRWSEREDLNLRPLVSQTSALTGLRHAPMWHPVALIRPGRKKRGTALHRLDAAITNGRDPK